MPTNSTATSSASVVKGKKKKRPVQIIDESRQRSSGNESIPLSDSSEEDPDGVFGCKDNEENSAVEVTMANSDAKDSQYEDSSSKELDSEDEIVCRPQKKVSKDESEDGGEGRTKDKKNLNTIKGHRKIRLQERAARALLNKEKGLKQLEKLPSASRFAAAVSSL
ncbi:hypothetical protein J7T55_006883 [Diaporthe amygdali]|uniref:uncharacterized protein n=1 Tax=Phomopsis amygdali TaxID=1214568 RepID=UPI0022FED8C0|nr:uncharacterized protein J7T55_006883 [Diaporthe amygdali]KAJ0125534.1 hypothetical protein J7T55_006883 [Diaporthe amygdali]